MVYKVRISAHAYKTNQCQPLVKHTSNSSPSGQSLTIKILKEKS